MMSFVGNPLARRVNGIVCFVLVASSLDASCDDSQRRVIATESYVRAPVDVETPIGLVSAEHARNRPLDPSSVSWTSSDDAVATVELDEHGATVVVGHSPGRATIRAVAAEGTTSVPVLITDAIALSLDVVAETRLPKGLPRSVRSIATYDDGSRHDVTSIATLMVDGVGAALDEELIAGESTTAVTATEGGSIELTATLEGVPLDTQSLRITDDEVFGITIDARTDSPPRGTPMKLRALATAAGGRSIDVSDFVTWTVFPEDQAGFDEDAGPGTLVATGAGDIEIRATYGEWSTTTTMTIGEQDPERLEIEPGFPLVPGPAKLAAGYSRGFEAVAYFDDGTNNALTDAVVWSTSDPDIATVSNRRQDSGVVHGHAPGRTRLVARLGSFSAEFDLEVTSAQLVSLSAGTANGDEIVMSLQLLQRLDLFGTFDDGSTLYMREPATPTLDPSCVRLVDDWVEPIAPGACDLVATIAGVSFTKHARIHRYSGFILDPFPTTVESGTNTQLVARELVGMSGFGAVVTEDIEWSLPPGSGSTVSNAPGTKGLFSAGSAGFLIVHLSYDDPTTVGLEDDGIVESDVYVTIE